MKALDSALFKRVGQELGASGWTRITQGDVDAYAALTGENLWIHTDPKRAETVGGAQIQASFILAKLGRWAEEVGAWIPEALYPLAYGFDKVRILSAAPVGCRLRCRVMLQAMDDHRLGIALRTRNTVESDAGERPVLVADWITLFVTREEH